MLRREKGFTLIELLIVVAIIGIIAAIAVPNLLTAIQRSKQKRTMADIRAVGTALGSYQVDYNGFPTAAANGNFSTGTLPDGYYNGSTKDGWGNQFGYQASADAYTMYSSGKETAKQNLDTATTSGWEMDVIFANGQMIQPES